MSIASRIQEIETHIGDVYDTINYSYDTTGVNKNIINIPKYLNKGYIDIINNGIDTLYNNFPKVSEIGSNLSLTPTYEAPIKLNEIQGDTLQDGTPTPSSPVPIQSVTGLQNIEVCGKNLCFNVTKPSNANLKFFINKSISKTFTISFTTNEALNGNSLYLEVDGTGYGNLGGITANANTKVEKTYTLSDTNYQAIENGTNIDLLLYKNGANFNIPDDGMVENNSTATSYEPYKGNTYEVNLGKNLLYNKDITSETTQYGVTITPNNDGTITLNGTNTKGSAIYINFYTGDYTSSGAFVINNIGNTLQTQTIDGYTLSISCSNGTINIGHNKNNGIWSIVVPNGNSYTNANIQFQLEKGQATSYSPYFTPIELNKIGTYQDSIKKSTGKNLFDKDNITTGKYIDASGNLVNDNSNFVGDYIPIDNTKSYYASQNVGGVIRVGYYDSNKTFISRQLISANYGSLTIPNNAVYVRLSCYNQSLDTLQLEIGTQQTSYEPYGKVWYEEKQIGKVVLNGSETYDVAGTNTSGKYKIRYDGVVNLIKRPANAGTIGDIISNQFIPLSANYTYRCNQGISVETNGKISFYDETLTQSTSAFTTWLASNNMTIKYALATPTYTKITNEELINQLEELYTAKSQEGTTNISITSEDLEMILNVSALKGEE